MGRTRTASLPLGSVAEATPRSLLLTGCRARDVDAGDVLVREGERSAGAWLVRTGAITETVTADSGRRATVDILGPGEIAGDVASLIDALAEGIEAHDPPLGRENHRDISYLPELRPLVPSRLLFVSARHAREVIAHHPELHSWIARRVNARAESLRRHLAHTLTLPVPDRLLAVLKDLASTHGRRTSAGRRIDLPLSQDTLASMVGATRESVNRAVRELLAEGLLRRDGRSYLLRIVEA